MEERKGDWKWEEIGKASTNLPKKVAIA